MAGRAHAVAELVLHHERVTYLVDPGADTLPLGGQKVRVFQWEDGSIELRHGDRSLPYSDDRATIAQEAIVENKRLGHALSIIQVVQAERDDARLASKKLTLRQKERLRAAVARSEPAADAPKRPDRLGGVLEYLARPRVVRHYRSIRCQGDAAAHTSHAQLQRGTPHRGAPHPTIPP